MRHLMLLMLFVSMPSLADCWKFAGEKVCDDGKGRFTSYSVDSSSLGSYEPSYQSKRRIQLENKGLSSEVAGSVAGVKVKFLVDTGATHSAVPERFARSLRGVEYLGQSRTMTASGFTRVSIWRVPLSIQGVSADLDITGLPTNHFLLGRDFLNSLGSWQMTPNEIRF